MYPTIESNPSTQVLLHAAKHPHAAVCGILLGPKENAARIDDAVPLFHHTTMNPLMETAFLLVRASLMHSSRSDQAVAFWHA